jgi:hypothetical protein
LFSDGTDAPYQPAEWTDKTLGSRRPEAGEKLAKENNIRHLRRQA